VDEMYAEKQEEDKYFHLDLPSDLIPATVIFSLKIRMAMVCKKNVAEKK